MEGLVRTAAMVVNVVISIAALIMSIRGSQLLKRRWEIEFLLEENRREAAKREEQIKREAAKREKLSARETAKREAAIQTLIDRSDRRFEALVARSDELAKQTAKVVARIVRNDTRLEVIEAARHRTVANPSAPAAGETEAVAAQAVPGERRPS